MDRAVKIKKDIIHFDTGRSWRGGQNQVFLLIKEFQKLNVPQVLISPIESPLYVKARKMGITVIGIDPRNDLDIIAGLKLRKAVKKFRAALIHFHTSKALGVGSWSLVGINAPKVFTRRVDFPLSNNIFNKMKYNSADIIVAISGFIRRQLESSGFEDIKKVYSSVETEKYECHRNYEDKKNITVGMAGALDLNHKDYSTFIKTAGYLVKKLNNKNMVFLIAGDGPDLGKIKKQISDENLENKVYLKGFVEDISTFFKEIDILVHNVNFEGLGTVILQGMASGLPVVATGVGGIPEAIKDGENGFLVKKKDYKETAQKINKLAADGRLREKMGKNGKETVKEKFSPRIMARKYIQIYEEF